VVKGGRVIGTAGVLLLASGCGITSDVYGVVGDEAEVFTGTATSYSNSGKIEISNGKGTSCIGDFFYSGLTSGHGFLNCSDGQRAQIQFRSTGLTSAYGFGTSTDGRSVRFTVGMSVGERHKYLGPTPQTAGAPAAKPPDSGSPASPSPASAQRTIATGTGFFVTRQGHFMTNAHVIKGCKSVTAQPSGAAALPATIVRSDPTNDLAVLTVSGAPPAVAPLRGGQPVRQGEAVVAYGFPLSGELSTGGITTSGTVSALAGPNDDTRFLQMSAPSQPGNSGGPLLDMTGAVVGVVSKGLNSAYFLKTTGNVPQNVNFAVKTEVVRTFLAAVGVTPETASGGRELSTPDVVGRARAFTVFVECKG
jgi:S1-C subfamily serine protease